ncbi:MAG: hypothetical protein IJR59_02710, partial [Firmicutes bacterium]|nr:hypothetical protein [Bacillota bacterium]
TMDDITDDIFEYCGTRKVYSDKEHPELMVYYSEKTKNNNHSGYGLSYEVLNTAKEYRPFIDDICTQTGLIYSCTTLGGKYIEESDISDILVKEYTGRNILSFSNPAYQLLSVDQNLKADLLNIIPDKEDEKLRYKDLPMRVNFYLYKDKIKYVNIFLLTDEENKVPTQNNLKQLSFDPLAAELVNSINTQSDYVKGTKNGVKYTIQKDIDNTPTGMKINVIYLEYSD